MRKLVLILLICFVACQNDVQNFTIEGVVSEKETGSPLAGIELKITSWYYGNSPDQSYSGEETKTVITNNDGKFNVAFDKGAFIEVKINKNGYLESHETKYIDSKKNVINIELKSKK